MSLFTIEISVSKEIERLARARTAELGTTLEYECEKLVLAMAEQQRHDNELKEQVNQAYEKMEKGDAVFLGAEDAAKLMEEKKAAIRNKS